MSEIYFMKGVFDYVQQDTNRKSKNQKKRSNSRKLFNLKPKFDSREEKSYEATVEMVADGEGKAQFNLHFPQR